MQRMTNWAKLFALMAAVLILLWIPFTRQLIVLILPLGSGIDDLAFFAVLAIVGALLLIRLIPVRDKASKIAKWLFK